MISHLFQSQINTFFFSLRRKLEIIDFAPKLSWLIFTALGLFGAVSTGFLPNILAVLIVFIAFLGLSLLGANDIEEKPSTPHLTASLHIIISVFVFMMSIGQSVAGSFMLLSFIVLFSSFWVLQFQKNIQENYKNKNFYNPSVLIDDIEIFVFLILVSIFPSAFSAIATLFGMLCWACAISKFYDVFKSID